MNKVFLVGNLTADPEVIKKSDQVTVGKCTIAVNGIKENDTLFAQVTSFNASAEILDKNFKKGDAIAITGHLQLDRWEDDKGKHQRVQIIAESIQFANGGNVNHVVLMGRLCESPEIRYTQSTNPVAVGNYNLAVNRTRRIEGQPNTDFFRIVTWGNDAESAEKHLNKGDMVTIIGRLQIRSWDDQESKRHWITEVVAEPHGQKFCGKAKSNQSNEQSETPEGFYPIDETLDDEDLPF